MTGWFIVVLFYSTTDAKLAMYKTEEECRKALVSVIEQNKNNPDVGYMECLEGRALKEEKD